MRLGRPTVSLSSGTGHGDFEDLDSERLGTQQGPDGGKPRVAAECTCTEREFGQCSRPTVRSGRTVNDDRDHADGSDTRPRGRRTGIVKLTKSSSIDPQDTGLQPVANPPCWASKTAASLNLTANPRALSSRNIAKKLASACRRAGSLSEAPEGRGRRHTGGGAPV